MDRILFGDEVILVVVRVVDVLGVVVVVLSFLPLGEGVLVRRDRDVAVLLLGRREGEEGVLLCLPFLDKLRIG